MTPACEPLVTHILDPFSTYRSPLRTARHAMAAASEPDTGGHVVETQHGRRMPGLALELPIDMDEVRAHHQQNQPGLARRLRQFALLDQRRKWMNVCPGWLRAKRRCSKPPQAAREEGIEPSK